MSTFRSIATATVLSLSLVLASSAAFAGEKGGAGKMAFPVAGATFKQHVEARLAKQSTRLEARIANDKVSAEKAAEMRARFAARKAKVEAAVEKAVADGTVTKEEAKEVRKAVGHGKRHGEGKGKGKPALAGHPDPT